MLFTRDWLSLTYFQCLPFPIWVRPASSLRSSKLFLFASSSFLFLFLPSCSLFKLYFFCMRFSRCAIRVRICGPSKRHRCIGRFGFRACLASWPWQSCFWFLAGLSSKGSIFLPLVFSLSSSVHRRCLRFTCASRDPCARQTASPLGSASWRLAHSTLETSC